MESLPPCQVTLFACSAPQGLLKGMLVSCSFMRQQLDRNMVPTLEPSFATSMAVLGISFTTSSADGADW
jgi:hypothetical protein